MILRDYQEEIKGRVYAAWEAGCRSVMCQMPTGTGKTVVLSQVICDALALSEERRVKSEEFKLAVKVLVVAHRKEILEQIRETLAKYGLGDKLVDGTIVVESIQKIARTGVRTKTIKTPSAMAGSANLASDGVSASSENELSPAAATSSDGILKDAAITDGDKPEKQCLVNKKHTSFLSLQTGEDAQRAGEGLLVIIDEAHHCTAKTYRILWEVYPKARFLGMTATPCRLKHEGFTELFDRLICSYSVKQFMDKGWLADYDYVVIRPDGEMKRRIDSLKKRGVDGDYQQKELGTVMDNRACIEQLFESYKKYAEGRQGIIYAINREHASHIASFFAEKMQCEVKSEECRVKSVAVVDSTTPRTKREQINADYREGKIRIIVNCDIYSEGVDMPDCSFIQLARPTLSLSKYIQQVGRGLRPNKDGRHTLILDNVGMYHLFGLPDAERDWQKMFREGQEAVTNEQLAVNNYFCRSHTKTDAMVDGHNLDMYVVDNVTREGKVEIAWTKHGGGYYQTFARKGEIIDRKLLFDECCDFVYGFCWVKYYKEETRKHFYNDCGNYIVSLPVDCEIMNSGFVCIRKKGFASYYDLKMRVYMTCLPDVYEYGDAEFVKFDGGLHLRNAEYGSIGFKKSNIKVKDGYVLAIDKNKNESYVIKDGGRIVYRVLGNENETATILWDKRYDKTLHKLQCGMITAFSKNGEPELYEKWKGVKDQLSKIMPLARKKAYSTEGDTPSLFEKDGLYGWSVGDKIRCKAKFKDILDASMYNFFLLVVNKKDRRILVNNDGYTIYDRYEIDKIDEDKVMLLPVDEIQECLKHSIGKVYVDIKELIAKSQENISEIVEYKDLKLRVKHEGKGTIRICPNDEELGHILLSNLEDKRHYLMFTDASDQNGRKIIYAKQRYYYVTDMHTEKYMYIEDVKTHKAYILSYSNTSYTLEIRERQENEGWNVKNVNEGGQGTANESIKKFLQRYSRVK